MDVGENKEVISEETWVEKSYRPEIKFDEASCVVNYKNINLNSQNPTTPEVILAVKKQPIHLLEGESYNTHAILIDKETEKMTSLAKRAQELRSIPEAQRPRAVLELLRDNLHYAYNDVVEEISKSEPDLAQWVAENTGLKSRASDVPISELFDRGYGICRHLAVAYLWLAQKAGLEGTLMSSGHGDIKNIRRTDTGEKLFRSVEIDQPAPSHSWVEIKTEDDRWIPVDPSVKLVGDTDEGLEMFRKANYKVNWGLGINIDAEPKELDYYFDPLVFLPAEPTAEGRFSLLLKSTKPTPRFRQENIPPTNIPYSGNGKLEIETTERMGIVNLAIVSAR